MNLPRTSINTKAFRGGFLWLLNFWIFGWFTLTADVVFSQTDSGAPNSRSAIASADPHRATPPLPQTVTFNAHIRPIMSNTCFACHGPDDETNESELRLDSFELATKYAIVPRNAAASEVYLRITDQDDPMPPADFRHQLSDYEKSLFEKWIQQGAVYEQHWSYAPIKQPPIPSIELIEADPESPSAKIDAFVQANLAVHGLRPTPKADRPTLLRRLSLDLIGLPPTPAEVKTFVNDTTPNAYQKQVERLLASPHYGERMASQWLDVVRFADTVGYHGDQNQNNFAYRDWVINALNDNKPFDQFTTEQLAGDLLKNPTQQQLIATGLVRLNMMTREGGAQPGEYLAKYTADRVRMLGTAWLGSTTGCCECHNHKYDPYTARDFYSLGAFFDDLRQWGVYTTYKYTPNADLKGFTNNHPFPPELRFKSDALQKQISFLQKQLENRIVAQSKPGALKSPKAQQWLASVKATLAEHPSGFIPLRVVSATAAKASIAVAGDTIIPTGPRKKGDTITVVAKFPAATEIRTLRLKVLPDQANRGYVGRSKDGRFRVKLTAKVRPETLLNERSEVTAAATQRVESNTEKSDSIEIFACQTDRETPLKYSSGRPSLFTGDTWQSGPAAWQLPTDEARLPHTAIYHLQTPLKLEPSEELVFELNSGDIGKFELAASPFTQFVIGQAPDLSDAATEEELLATYYLCTTPIKKHPPKIAILRNDIIAARSGFAMTTVAQPLPIDSIKPARILPRGNWLDQSGAEVVPAFPEFLAGTSPPAAPQKRLNRLDLARWLTSDSNPLVARHYVNRTWKHFFGRGLSAKLDDLGNQGEWPSHPMLLDALAAEFRSNWDMKNIARLIVNSHTYQQRASVRSDLNNTDPYNRLLSQQSARRLEAEIIRDNALAIAGILSTEYIGGPSIFPFQPQGYYSNIQFPSRKYVSHKDRRRYRRGVYMHWQRTFLHPMLVNFDAPSRDECVADRTESNSPQQALTLLNDPTFTEAAVAMAKRLLTSTKNEATNLSKPPKTQAQPPSIPSAIETAFRLAVSRRPNDTERLGLTQLYQRQFQHFQTNTADARMLLETGANAPPGEMETAKLAAFAQVCRVILNLHETITRF